MIFSPKIVKLTALVLFIALLAVTPLGVSALIMAPNTINENSNRLSTTYSVSQVTFQESRVSTISSFAETTSGSFHPVSNFISEGSPGLFTAPAEGTGSIKINTKTKTSQGQECLYEYVANYKVTGAIKYRDPFALQSPFYPKGHVIVDVNENPKNKITSLPLKSGPTDCNRTYAYSDYPMLRCSGAYPLILLKEKQRKENVYLSYMIKVRPVVVKQLKLMLGVHGNLTMK